MLSLRPHVVVVGGWDQLAYALPYVLKSLLRHRIVLWSESTEWDQRRRSLARRAMKRLFVRLADAVLVPGSAAARYVRTLGARVVVTAPNACDTRLFRVADWSEQVRRAPTGTRRSPLALFVGRLSPEKGIDVLLRAWRAVEGHTDADLVLIGAGPSEAALRSQGQALGLRRVVWVPFSEPEDLVSWYRQAAVLVLPSRSEPWGFVINEAMACGLPVIASEACGAAHDLVVDGVTGWRIGRADADALAGYLIELLSDTALQRRMGLAARAMAGSFTPERWSERVAQLVSDLA
ncbi:MAG: glycosyltransferase family 4 protein [Acidimicrobiales bacterium]